jgi:mRNA interferase MazF
MEKLMKGDVVVLPFPFSDLSSLKKRPALVAATLEGNDIILCQITSVARDDKYSVPLSVSDFKQGGLRMESVIRPNRLFTADKSLVIYKAGSLKNAKVNEVEKKVVNIFTAS